MKSKVVTNVIACLFGVVGLGLLIGNAYSDNGIEKQYQRTLIAERQLLQMVVNTTSCYWENRPITQSITAYYPDDDLDTSVYTYTYNVENMAIIGTAKDSSLVPSGMEKIGYFIKTGRKIMYKYSWM